MNDLKEILGNLYSPVMIAALFLLAFVLYLPVRWFAVRLLRGVLVSTPQKNPEEVRICGKIASSLAILVPAILIIVGSQKIPDLNGTLSVIIARTGFVIIYGAVMMALFRGMDLLNLIYSRKERAREYPIKGILQMIKIIICTVVLVLVFSLILDKSPVILLSGLGAVAAVLILIFQDTILSAIAGIELGSNDMIRMGDWIEVPGTGADGEVVEIALHTIKVKNWD